jgi:flagellar motility protein MotE (MotC chaperone)
MSRIWVAITAVAGFLGVWFGLAGEVDPSGRGLATLDHALSDSLVLSRAKDEAAAAAAAEAASPDSKSNTAVAPEPDAASDGADSCLPRAALGDLVNRRKELEKREAAIAAREQELAAREKATQEELKKIQQVRAEIDEINGARTKESDERVSRTVEVLEAMTPKAASQVIATYDERLAVKAMSRMSTPKLSKILNLMDPKRSVRLMELLAGGGAPAGGAEAAAPNTNAVTK